MSEEQFIRISDIDEFVNWVNSLEISGNALYRGMSSEHHEPSASLARRMKDLTEPTEQDMWSETVRLIKGAKVEGYDRDPTRRGEMVDNDFELLALLQHHGAATPLIDFSYNPLVALWFACADNHDKKNDDKANDGKVVVINPTDIRTFGTINVTNHKIYQQGIVDTESGKRKKSDLTDGSVANMQAGTQVRLWRFNPPGFDARILAQSSEFILGKIELEGNDIYAKCIIAQGMKADMRQQLNRRYGISDKQLFRDLQGYAYINAHDRPIERKTADEYKQLGMEYLQRKEYDQAIENFTKAIDINPDDQEVYYNRGSAYDNKGDYDRAIADYEKAIEINPNYAKSYHNRGNAHARKGNYDRAMADYDKVLQLNPNDATAYYNRGNAYAHKDDYSRAIVDYNKALEINPNFTEAYHNRGLAKSLSKDTDGATADLQQALTLATQQKNTALIKHIQQLLDNLPQTTQPTNG